jgi:hypothetical protein
MTRRRWDWRWSAQERNRREITMGRFVLQFEDQFRPLPRGKTVVAKAFFAARLFADALLVVSLVYLGWMFTMGDVSPLQNFGRMI